jgi:hypothetical protein
VKSQTDDERTFDPVLVVADNLRIVRHLCVRQANEVIQYAQQALLKVLSQLYERASTIVTSNLPFDGWTSVVSSECLTTCRSWR